MSQLAAGTRIGPYEIVAQIGVGGMGEVYRATDTRLKRQVALKVLPVTVTADPDRLARFQREAEILASLNHPNIAALYGFEDDGAVKALVMELIEGPTLADRITQGALPLDEAVPIGRQIAEALEAAHERGIIHRDLKPANIKLRPDGTVKVLDFGLAKAMDQGSGIGDQGSGNLANSPTITSPAMTMPGVILGTAAYMSPEQARGTRVDKRADIWAFGCVLYEMLTGRRAFDSDNATDIVASIIRADPDWARLPAGTPSALRTLLNRCLAKDTRQRLDSAAAIRLELNDAFAQAPAAPSSSRHWVAVVGTAALTLVTIGTTYFAVRQRPDVDNAPTVRFEIPGNSANALAVSPDGRYVVYQDSQGGSLLLRALDSQVPKELPGTRRAVGPFWSPDNRFVAFGVGTQLMKVPIAGGPSIAIVDSTSEHDFLPTTGTWAPDGTILVTSNGSGESALFKIKADGSSAPERINGPVGTLAVYSPRFLPDGRHYSYSVSATNARQRGVYIADLDGGEPQRLLPEITAVNYSSGYLLFVREGTLMAQPFDATQRRLSGEAVPLIEKINWTPVNGRIAVDASTNGTLAYRLRPTSTTRYQLTWFDRSGAVISKLGGPSQPNGVSLSPDGKTIAVHLHQGNGGDIWLMDVATDSATRFTFDESLDNSAPTFSPDGRSLAYVSRHKDSWHTVVRQTDGLSGERIVTQWNDGPMAPMSWSPDGRAIVTMRNDPTNGWDVINVAVDSGALTPLLNRPFREGFGQVSPNGQWLAFSSNEDGKAQVFLQSYPSGPVKRQISEESGNYPRWRADGREVFFLTGSGVMMAAEVRSTGAVPDIARPRPLFKTDFLSGPVAGHSGNYNPYAVSGDGTRFLIPVPVDETPENNGVPPISVVVNWTSMLKGSK